MLLNPFFIDRVVCRGDKGNLCYKQVYKAAHWYTALYEIEFALEMLYAIRLFVFVLCKLI